ncbi:MAG TPA: Rnase Y domain-containing protein, partial [Bacteroidia bacterium]|nr:Rnase Y domain-containing protein [Bacteroidia bacterium]
MQTDIIIIISAAVASLAIGFLIAWFVVNRTAKAKEEGALDKAQTILKEAEMQAEATKKNKILEAKEKFFQLKTEHEKAIGEKDRTINQAESRIKQKEATLSQKIEQAQRKQTELDGLQQKLNGQIEGVTKRRAELENEHAKQVEALEKISGMSAEQAKAQLVEALKAEAKTEALSHIKDIVEESKLTANKEAKRIVIQTIQRVASEHAIENAVSTFNIDNDEIKGRIIGREGRNIRALEAATGVEIIVDDTPETIILSCFDPVRRELARLALHQLVTDGRIHPA